MKNLLPRKEVLDELLRSVGATNRDTMQKVLHQARNTPPEKRPEKMGKLIAQHLWTTEGPKTAAILFRDMIKGKKDFTDTIRGNENLKNRAYRHVFPGHCFFEVQEADRHLNEKWKDLEPDKTIVPDEAQRWIDELVKKKREQQRKAAAQERKKKAKIAADSTRGRKIMDAAHQSGVCRAAQFKSRIIVALKELDQYARKNCPPAGMVSITEARTRIARKHGMCSKTIERHDTARREK